MSSCPCGSGAELAQCYNPIIEGAVAATTAEQLMRARYTAHTLANMAFILKTHHPAKRTDIDENATAQWARESEWLGLEIMDVEGGEEDNGEGRIEFRARYRDTNKQRYTHHEKAIFEKYNGEWFFKDAEVPQIQQFRRDDAKQGRNDPCACGSGKKYKKCCGKAA